MLYSILLFKLFMLPMRLQIPYLDFSTSLEWLVHFFFLSSETILMFANFALKRSISQPGEIVLKFLGTSGLSAEVLANIW